MSEPKDGGPAFPDPLGSNIRSGMSLRDWFAGQALLGLLANVHIDEPGGKNEYARSSYVLADAMLAAREAK